MPDKKDSSFLDGIIAGALLGGALAVLFAPLTGQQLRKKIQELIDDSVWPEDDKTESHTEEDISKSIDTLEEEINKLSKSSKDKKGKKNEL